MGKHEQEPTEQEPTDQERAWGFWRGYSTIDLGDIVLLSLRHVPGAASWVIEGVVTDMGTVLGEPALRIAERAPGRAPTLRTVLLSDIERGGVCNLSETRP